MAPCSPPPKIATSVSTTIPWIGRTHARSSTHSLLHSRARRCVRKSPPSSTNSIPAKFRTSQQPWPKSHPPAARQHNLPRRPTHLLKGTHHEQCSTSQCIF